MLSLDRELLYPAVEDGGGLYIELVADELEDEEDTTIDGDGKEAGGVGVGAGWEDDSLGGRGGGGGGGGGGSRMDAARAAWSDTDVVVLLKLLLFCKEVIVAASRYLWRRISVRTVVSSNWRDWMWCWRAEIAPMQPYIGSLSLKLAS